MQDKSAVEEEEEEEEGSERSVDETVMPAEIDTGGPTVLHCDYRADCPIPIVTSATTAESSLCRETTTVAERLVATLTINAIDDRRSKSLASDRRDSCTILESFRRRCFATWLRRRRNQAVLPLPLAPGFRVSDHDALSTEHSPTLADDDSESSSIERRPTITTETRRRGGSTARRENDTRVDDSGDRRWRRSKDKRGEEEEKEGEDEEEKEEECSRGCANRPWTSGGIWPRRVRIGKSTRFTSQPDDTDREENTLVASSASGAGLPSLAEEGTTGKEVEYASAGCSSESRVAKVARRCSDRSRRPAGDSLSFESLTRKKRRRRACTRILGRGRRSTYVQLALLLFLVAFGQCGLRKSLSAGFNNHRYCARPSTAAGFSVLAIGTVISAVSAAPVDLTGDAGVRAERSANLSHITGASRKIQMYIKNRHLQILPDGTVNGSNDDTSDYSE